MKQELKVKRPDGRIETVSFNKAPISKALFARIKEETSKAGRGEVIEATIYKMRNNLQLLMKKYNDLHNEGGEGYMPEVEYFAKSPNFISWEEVETIK